MQGWSRADRNLGGLNHVKDLQGRHFLQIPGPSPVPDRVLRAMDMPVIDHRSAKFAELGKAVLEGSQKIFQTSGPVIIFPSSGTGAWEAALARRVTAVTFSWI